MVNLEELHAAVLNVPGVVGAVVSPSDSGPPSVRIWTDDSRNPDDLEAEVKSLVIRSGRGTQPDSPIVPEPIVAVPDVAESPAAAAPGNGRRSGLGRGLDKLFPDAGEQRPPAHLVSIDLTKSPTLEMIAIEESAAGVVVRAHDTARNVAETKVLGAASSVNPAIVAVVAELLGELPAPRLVSVELRDTEVAAVLVVTLELADTTVTAGAAVVQGGMPFTLGKAAWSAIKSVRP